jgi:hypothetical protein
MFSMGEKYSPDVIALKRHIQLLLFLTDLNTVLGERAQNVSSPNTICSNQYPNGKQVQKKPLNKGLFDGNALPSDGYNTPDQAQLSSKN